MKVPAVVLHGIVSHTHAHDTAESAEMRSQMQTRDAIISKDNWAL